MHLALQVIELLYFFYTLANVDRAGAVMALYLSVRERFRIIGVFYFSHTLCVIFAKTQFLREYCATKKQFSVKTLIIPHWELYTVC